MRHVAKLIKNRLVAALMRTGRLAPLALWCYHWLYPSPVCALAPERLYLYLDTLLKKRALDGEIVEIGSFLCGASIMATKMLCNIGASKPYTCIDTFNGFVAQQISDDIQKGTPADLENTFPASFELVTKILSRHGVSGVQLIQGDICANVVLPGRIAVALLDCNLEEPIRVGLEKLYPRLVSGGCILVDDCAPAQGWRARFGYQRFCADHGISERYLYGMGIIEKML